MVGSPSGRRAGERRRCERSGHGSGPSDDGPMARCPPGVVPQLHRIERKVRREATRLAGLSFQQLPPREAVRMAYNVLLRRDPDEPAWTEQAGAMAAGLLTHADMVDRIRCSNEFRTARADPPGAACTAPSTPAGASSSSACPRPGASSTWAAAHTSDARGALVALGLSLRLRRAGDRRPAPRRPPPASTSRSASGPATPIGAGSATSTGRWPTCRSPRTPSVDLVYSGQSIEHVTEADG